MAQITARSVLDALHAAPPKDFLFFQLARQHLDGHGTLRSRPSEEEMSWATAEAEHARQQAHRVLERLRALRPAAP